MPDWVSDMMSPELKSSLVGDQETMDLLVALSSSNPDLVKQVVAEGEEILRIRNGGPEHPSIFIG